MPAEVTDNKTEEETTGKRTTIKSGEVYLCFGIMSDKKAGG
jgi:hypothetical protein